MTTPAPLPEAPDAPGTPDAPEAAAPAEVPAAPPAPAANPFAAPDGQPGNEAPGNEAPGNGVPGQAPPYPGAVPYWPHSYPMPPAPRNGLGVSAMVLGIVGTVMALTYVLFWVAWLPALVGLVLGVVAMGQVRKGVATNRGTALAGVVLGVSGLLLSAAGGGFFAWQVHEARQEVKATENAARERIEAQEKQRQADLEKRRAEIEEQRKRTEAEQERKAAEERSRHLAFGQSYTTPDGLRFTVEKPGPFSPDEFAQGIAKGDKVVEVVITVTNTTGEQRTMQFNYLKLTDGVGGRAETVVDGSGRHQPLGRSVPAGQTMTGREAFAVPPGATDKVEVSFDYDLTNRRTIYWTGSL
ncbi:hypothetical protein GCM10020229_67690 [Kitasatospora albolonga]|uniref:DUF4190 domain-containing protein n=1 Tax=Kitasatospora albolonga TaxID=68173 RepID=UPI0031EFF02A